MDLLNGIRPTIYAALEDVKDTFFQVPCIYSLAGQAAISNFMEDLDNEGGKSYTEYTFNTLFEDSGTFEKTRLKESQSGVLDENEVRVTVFVSTLTALSLWVGNTHILKSTEDYFTVKGVQYRVENIYMDGFFDENPQLVVIIGTKIITAA